MVKVGVIGSGFMGRTHALNYVACGAKVVGVSSINIDEARQLAAEVGAEPFSDALALIRDARVEAVSITLPSFLHAEYAIAALESGKHVLLEKPMALSVAECDAMMAAMRASGKVLMVAHVLRFWPEYQLVRELLAQGKVTSPRFVKAWRLSGPLSWGAWYADPSKSGGVVFEGHIHDLDIVQCLFGTPKRIYARGYQGSNGNWEHISSLLEVGTLTCSIEASMAMPESFPFTMGLAITGEASHLEFVSRAPTTKVETGQVAYNHVRLFEQDKPAVDYAIPEGNAYRNEVAYFVRCLRDNPPPEEGTVEQGRAAVRLAEAVRESLETGKVVSIDSC